MQFNMLKTILTRLWTNFNQPGITYQPMKCATWQKPKELLRPLLVLFPRYTREGWMVVSCLASCWLGVAAYQSHGFSALVALKVASATGHFLGLALPWGSLFSFWWTSRSPKTWYLYLEPCCMPIQKSPGFLEVKFHPTFL